MMGVTHATSGAAAWVAITGTMPILTLGAYPLDPVGVLAGAAVCAGAALLPDADHHSATIAHSVPVLGRVVAGTVGVLSGGHRQGAHSVVAVAVVAAAAWALTLVTLAVEEFGTIAVGAGVGTAVLTCFGLKARDFVRTWAAAWALGAVLGACIVVFAPEQVAWFPLAVTIGFVAHLAGDFLTTGGVPGPVLAMGSAAARTAPAGAGAEPRVAAERPCRAAAAGRHRLDPRDDARRRARALLLRGLRLRGPASRRDRRRHGRLSGRMDR